MRDYHFAPLQGADWTTLPFPSDEAAIRHGLTAFDGGCEIWERYRMLGRFHGPQPVETDASTLAA